MFDASASFLRRESAGMNHLANSFMSAVAILKRLT